MVTFLTIAAALWLTRTSTPEGAAEPGNQCVALGRQVTMGADEAVLKQPIGAGSPPCARYLQARAKLRTKKDLEGALITMTELAKEPAPLSDWAKAYALELSFKLGRPPTVSPPVAPFVEAATSELYFAASRGLADAAAVAALEEAITSGKRAKAIAASAIAIAAFEREKVDPVPPVVDMARRFLFVEAPDDDAAPLAFPKASLDDLVRRAEVASERHMNADVLKTVDAAFAMPEVPKDDRCRLLFFKGAALRKQRKYALSEQALIEAAQRCDQVVGEFYKRASFLLAQVQVIGKPLDVAEKTLNSFAEKFRGDSLVDDTLFLLAVAQDKAQQAKAAEATYDRVAKMDGDKCGEARFRAAYSRYKDGRYKLALPLFTDIAAGQRCSDEYERLRGLYWESRTRDRLKQKRSDVEKPLQAILALSPLSYYGLVATQRLQKAFTFKLPVAPNTRPMGALLSTQEAQRALALTTLGLYSEAKAELAPLEGRLGNDGERAAFADLLSEAFDPYRSHLLARTQLKDLLGPVPDVHSLALWGLAYPRPFPEVLAAEREEDLPTDLLLALIREESAFMMQVGSWANAYGLTQLLVETAEMTARDMKWKRQVTAADLRSDAGLSIRLGAHHVAMLRRKFSSPPLWLAAYNAGAGNVEKWVKARGDKPLDEFVEEIPLDETRGYVKRILRSWAVYRVLSGRPIAELSLAVK